MADTPDYFRLQVAHKISQMGDVAAKKNLKYTAPNGKPLFADVYYLPNTSVSSFPAVVFVHGDAAPESLRDIKDSGQYASWARLVAATGLVAVTFNHRSSQKRTAIHEPASDVEALFKYVLERANKPAD